MSPFRDRWPGLLTTGLVAFSSGITLYLIISDTARRSEIRRRKNFLQAVHQLDEGTLVEAQKLEPLAALERARHRWAVLRVGGRFVNPFDEYVSRNCPRNGNVCRLKANWGDRWREQGAWEWVMWKVLTLFKFNPAGLPRDRNVSPPRE